MSRFVRAFRRSCGAILLLAACLADANAQVAIGLEKVQLLTDVFEPWSTGFVPGMVKSRGFLQPTVFDSQGTTWLVTRQIYRISGAIATPQDLGQCFEPARTGQIRKPRTEYKVTALTPFEGRWYIGTDHGLFVTEGDRLRPLVSEDRCLGREEAYLNQGEFKSNSVSLLWESGGRLWFKASDYGLGRVENEMAHPLKDTNRRTAVADVDADSVYAVRHYTDCDLLLRLRAGESADAANARPRSGRIEFLTPDNGRESPRCERRILEVKVVKGRRWILATDGVYLQIGDQAFWLGPPAVSHRGAVRLYADQDDALPPNLSILGKLTNESDMSGEGEAVRKLFYAQSRNDGDGMDLLEARSRIGPCPSEEKCFSEVMISLFVTLHDVDFEKLAHESRVQKLALWGHHAREAAARLKKILRTRLPSPIAVPDVLPSPPEPSFFIDANQNGVVKHIDASRAALEYSLACSDGSRLQRFTNFDGLYRWNRSPGKTYELLLKDSFNRGMTMDPDSNSSCGGFLTSDAGLYRVSDVQGPRIVPLPALSLAPNSMMDRLRLSDGEDFLISTSEGFFEFINDKLLPLKTNASSGDVAPIRDANIIATGENTWIVTHQGVYLFRPREKRVDLVPRRLLADPQVQTFVGKPWIVSNDGIYRVFENASISGQIEPQDATDKWKQLLQWILGRDVFVSGVYNLQLAYVDQDGASARLAARLPQTQFDFIAETSEEAFQQRVANNRFSAEQTPLILSAGTPALYLRVRDNYGNTFDIVQRVTVWPTAGVVPILILALGALLMTVALLGAPYSRFLRLAVANPWLRNYGSFGLIPLLLTTMPPLRSHLLRRYLAHLRKNRELSAAARDFVPPGSEFTFDSFHKTLSGERKLLLLGRSGLGKTSLFRYLCVRYAHKSWFESRPIPVFIPLARYQSVEPATMFARQLASLGDVYDEELAAWFLRQGGFVIFFDGLNEISDDGRARLNSFFDAIWQHNLICISSQQKYEEFSWLTTINLSTLSDSEIRTILERHLQPAQLVRFFDQLDVPMREIYGIPQNLLFAVSVLKRDSSLPRTRFQLYRSVFSPIEARWADLGVSGMSTLLFQRAFDMLSLRLPFFESGEFHAPEPVVSELVEHKLLARSGEQLIFSHDLVRAFFAANHFMNVWEDDEHVWQRQPDRNWLPMIEFCLSEFSSPPQVARLLQRLIGANTRLAGEVFQILKRQYPGLVEATTEEQFLRQFAKASLPADPDRPAPS